MSERRLKQINEEIDVLRQEQEDLKRKRRWTCTECGGTTAVSKLIIVERWWYEEPYSCAGGDAWHPSDDYDIWCDKCNNWVRAYKRKRISDWDIKDKHLREQLERQAPENKSFWMIKDNKYRVAELHQHYRKWHEDFDLEQLRKEKKEREDRYNNLDW